MPANKKQLQRLIMLVAELKENRYPSAASFCARLRDMDLQQNRNLACTPKTVQRDIRTLREEFGAPVEYAPDQGGYRLAHHGWDFQCPVFEEEEMVGAILGRRLAEQIFPDPLRSAIGEGTDRLLAGNNPDFLDTAMIHSLIIASGLKVPIRPDVFAAVFEGWQRHRAVLVAYRSATGEVTTRTIEPHALVFQDSAWFIKARCLLRDAIRTFAVHRIQDAELLAGTFEPDPEIIRQAREGMLFDYQQATRIRIRCQCRLLPYITEQPLHSRQRIEMHPDGAFTLVIPSATACGVIAWVLSQAGAATLLAPAELRHRLAKIGAEIHRHHRA